MGKNNRQRRAAKQRKRNAKKGSTGRAGSTSRPGGGARRESSDPRLADPAVLFMAAVQAYRDGDDELVDVCVGRFAAMPQRSLATELASLLELQVSYLWDGGWQPLVLHHAVEREIDRDAATVLRCLLASESAGYERLGRDVAPEWMHQLDVIDAIRWWDEDRPYLLQLPVGWTELLHVLVHLMYMLGTVPEIPTLAPPPSRWRPGMRAAVSHVPDGLLERVRGLLAKAESTEFEAEAEAFTAKAQALMARHRVDRAVIDAAADRAVGGDEPVGRRLLIEDPYAETKAVLLSQIAEANGGHCVWSKGLGFSTVFARADELDVIEHLFTSLLVQATAALRREGSKVDRSGRSRTTRFRRSFLFAFAQRVGERLRETVEAAVADAESETGASLLPVLAGDVERARRAAEQAFPELTAIGGSITDDEGWMAGSLFGDRADLGVGDPLAEQAAS